MCEECKSVRERFKASECSCETCRSMCRRPCWLLPDEVEQVEAVVGKNVLMRDYWIRDGGYVLLMSAPLIGYEGEQAPYRPFGGCALLKDGLCSIHANKPFEGRAASHEKESVNGLHKAVARAWFIHNGGNPDYFDGEPEECDD